MSVRLFGIKFTVTFYFAALITFMLSLNAPITVIYAVVFSVIHELGHLSAMVLLNNKPQAVIFEITGMNILRTENYRTSIKNEIVIALAGPFMNFLCFVFFCFMYASSNNRQLMIIACINLVLMVFNLLPIKRLDGGMALYFALSKFFSVKCCSLILLGFSCVFIALIYLWGIYVFISTHYNFSVLIIAFFLTLSMFGSNEY